MALTLQVQSLQCNVPHLIGMRDESKKAKFPVLPLVAVDFLFWNCSPFPPVLTHVTSCVHAIPPCLQWLWMLWRQNSLLWLRCPIPVLAAFTRQFHPVSAQGFYVFFSLICFWLICFCLQDVGLLEIPAELAALLHFVEGENPPPSLLFLHCFTEYFLVYIKVFFVLPAVCYWAGFYSLSLQCKYDKGKWYHGCCFLTW